MRVLATLAVSLGIGAAVFAQNPVPRQSPEFPVYIPGGKQLLLSQYKGKVVLLEFLFTTCPHCQHEAGLISKLNTELGPKGLQPIGVAVNFTPEQVTGGAAASLSADFARVFNVNFPVGYGDRDLALNYLGISPAMRWVVPQVVLIDRKGVVRYQTPPLGTDEITKEDWLRAKLDELLKEPAATTSHKSATSHKTASARKPS